MEKIYVYVQALDGYIQDPQFQKQKDPRGEWVITKNGKIVYDNTEGGNPWKLGDEKQFFENVITPEKMDEMIRFKQIPGPMEEFQADIYLENNRILRIGYLELEGCCQGHDHDCVRFYEPYYKILEIDDWGEHIVQESIATGFWFCGLPDNCKLQDEQTNMRDFYKYLIHYAGIDWI